MWGCLILEPGLGLMVTWWYMINGWVGSRDRRAVVLHRTQAAMGGKGSTVIQISTIYCVKLKQVSNKSDNHFGKNPFRVFFLHAMWQHFIGTAPTAVQTPEGLSSQTLEFTTPVHTTVTTAQARITTRPTEQTTGSETTSGTTEANVEMEQTTSSETTSVTTEAKVQMDMTSTESTQTPETTQSATTTPSTTTPMVSRNKF